MGGCCHKCWKKTTGRNKERKESWLIAYGESDNTSPSIAKKSP